MAGEFGNPEIVQEEVDILLIGGGMACCGAAYEVMQWADAAKKEGPGSVSHQHLHRHRAGSG